MEGKPAGFSHGELMEVTTIALNELLAQDTFLCDLPKAVTLEEVNNQIALQYGQSMTIYLIRGDDETVPVVVPQVGSTVADLKKSIRRCVGLKLKRSRKVLRRPKLLSWKYIWKTYYLKHGNSILTDNNKQLSSLNIKNKSEITFVKKKNS